MILCLMIFCGRDGVMEVEEREMLRRKIDEREGKGMGCGKGRGILVKLDLKYLFVKSLGRIVICLN